MNVPVILMVVIVQMVYVLIPLGAIFVNVLMAINSQTMEELVLVNMLIPIFNFIDLYFIQISMNALPTMEVVMELVLTQQGAERVVVVLVTHWILMDTYAMVIYMH